MIKTIPDFPKYGADIQGNIWYLPKMRKLKPVLNHARKQSAYLVVTLRDSENKERNMKVHRLVLMAFKGNPQEGQESRHLNGNNFDNRLENLSWGTMQENQADNKLHGKHRFYGNKYVSLTETSQ